MRDLLPRRPRARHHRPARAAARPREPTRGRGSRPGLAGRPRTSLPGRQRSAPRRSGSGSAAPIPRGGSRPRASRRAGSSSAGPVAASGHGVLVSLVEPDGERSMCPDRGVATALEPEEILAEHLAGCDWLQVSGYALMAEPVATAAATAVQRARAAGARVGIDLASWSGIRDHGAARFRDAVAALAPDVVFANEEEDAAIGGHWRRTRVGAEARRARAARSTGWSAPPCRSTRSSTPPERATP